MFARFNLPFRYRFTLTLARVIEVEGVNSLLSDGNHILMWDFDRMSIEEVKRQLLQVQRRNVLPRIVIVQTAAEGDRYHAYCLARCSLQRAASIVASTPGVDGNFFKWGVYRGRFTLRLSAKRDFMPLPVVELPSGIPDEVKPSELSSFVRYQTLPHRRQ